MPTAVATVPPARDGFPNPGGDGAVRLLGACVVDCVWCGDHNRLLAVASDGVIARCLRCGDYERHAAVPTWCPELRKRRNSKPFVATS